MAAENGDSDAGFGFFEPPTVSNSMAVLTKYLAESAEAANKIADVAAVSAKLAEVEAEEDEEDDMDSEDYDDNLVLPEPVETAPGEFEIAIPKEEPGTTMTMAIDLE